MRQKNKRSIDFCQDSKQNYTSNLSFSHPTHDNKIGKKTLSLKPIIQSSSLHKNPLQLRELCQIQEKQILNQYRKNTIFKHHQFYQFIQEELPNTDICYQIMRIKYLSNEEAVQELKRIQQQKQLNSQMEPQYQESMSQRQDEMQMQQKMFKENKKVSIIQQNEQVFYRNLNIQKFRYDYQEVKEDEDPLGELEDNIGYQFLDLSYLENKKCQYLDNDDIFEF